MHNFTFLSWYSSNFPENEAELFLVTARFLIDLLTHGIVNIPEEPLFREC